MCGRATPGRTSSNRESPWRSGGHREGGVALESVPPTDRFTEAIRLEEYPTVLLRVGDFVSRHDHGLLLHGAGCASVVALTKPSVLAAEPVALLSQRTVCSTGYTRCLSEQRIRTDFGIEDYELDRGYRACGCLERRRREGGTPRSGGRTAGNSLPGLLGGTSDVDGHQSPVPCPASRH